MKHYVYIIESLIDGTFYKGYSENYVKRLEEHNQGLSKYTSKKIPWKLRYVEVHANKTDALKREKMFKQQNRKYFEWLFVQETNIILK